MSQAAPPTAQQPPRRPAEAPRPEARRRKGITWRSIALSLALIPANAYWVVQMERIRYSAHPTTVSLFFNAVFILLVVTFLNALVGRKRPKWALEKGELLVVYMTMALASCLSAHDLLQILVPMLVWPFRFRERPGFEDTLELLPSQYMVENEEVYLRYFIGNDTFYRWEYIQAWAFPVLMWTLFLTALLGVMLCTNVLLRAQWTNRERLTYPIIQLPLAIADVGEGGRLPALFRNKLFWLGFVLAGSADVVNSLNLYYPSIPTILTPGFGESYLRLDRYFTNKPMNAIGWTPLSWYPFLIGLGMLMPVDFLFSAWFFYLFWKAQLIFTAAFGWDQDPKFPYPNAQAFGAYMAFIAYTLWLSRNFLGNLVRKIMGASSDLDDSRDALTFRQAVLGIVIGMVFLVWFSGRLGIGPLMAVAFFGIYMALALAITRMRAELGTPIHDLHFTGPDWMLTEVIGTRDLDQSTLSGFTMYFWFNRAYRGHPMPHQLEGFKLAEQTDRRYKAWFWWMLAVGAIGAVAGFWAMLHLNYQYGATAKSHGTFGNEAFVRLVGWLNNPKPTNTSVVYATGVGFVFAMFLQMMRIRFPWWPFHPLGYAVTSSWEIGLVWMPLFIAWILKLSILRYTGLPGFRRSLPFFFGLMLGQFVVGSFLNFYGILWGVPTYQFWQ